MHAVGIASFIRRFATRQDYDVGTGAAPLEVHVEKTVLSSFVTVLKLRKIQLNLELIVFNVDDAG